MNNPVKHVLIVLLLFSLMASCDPCDDCESISYEPTVSLVFINADSLQNLDSLLFINSQKLDSLDSIISDLTDTLVFLNDSLDVINNAIDEGEDLSTEKASIENAISIYGADQAVQTSEADTLSSINTLYSDTKTTINSGLMHVDQISILGTDNVFSYPDTDSATSWSIPLAYDGSFTDYEITINGITETIVLSYDVFQEVDVQRNVLIRAQNIQVVNAPYDSLINCEENCLDGETTFTFYY